MELLLLCCSHRDMAVSLPELLDFMDMDLLRLLVLPNFNLFSLRLEVIWEFISAVALQTYQPPNLYIAATH